MIELSSSNVKELHIRQRKELAEFFGFETRNKYEVRDATGNTIGFAAEQGKGLAHFFGRSFFGHWRSFEVHIFDRDRRLVLRLEHPFRWYFQRIEVYLEHGTPLGALEKRFSFFNTRFIVEDARGRQAMEVNRPFWAPWTFTFSKEYSEVGRIKKRWSGLFRETFTDGDNFTLHFDAAGLTTEERQLMLAAAFFIDIHYFEKRAQD